jgi:hypothetical protein
VPRDRASKIQILSAKHDGLLLAVDKMFDKFATLQQVQEMIERKYHEKLSCGAVLTYKTRHWKVQKDRIREQKAAMKAIAQLVGEDGLSAGVMALLWQALQTMTPPQLIALQRALDNHQKTELAKEQFALHAEALRLKMRKDRRGKTSSPDGSPREDGAADFAEAQKVVERIREIFGIGPASIEPPDQALLGPAEESPSPEAVAADGTNAL